MICFLENHHKPASTNCTMAPTRHEGFVRAFEKFMEYVYVLSRNENMIEYTLTSFTTNQRCCDHEYMLRIPRESVVYDILSNDPAIENCRVVRRQDIPTIEEMREHVHDSFACHSLTKNGIIMSFVDMVDMGFTDNDQVNGDFYAKVEVCYHKSHIPFRMPLTPLEESKKKIVVLETRINILKNELEEKQLESDNNRRLIKRERKLAKEKYSKLVEKMQIKMRGFYKDSEKPEDCPVCYEVIDSAKLKVPGCWHFICTDCSGRCTVCPICREQYV
uniref:RING-type domain-containing protein n=1 Tax=viral metagenome TaxID=1070528 RepID=A0A6C0JLK9_9ZZZZ